MFFTCFCFHNSYIFGSVLLTFSVRFCPYLHFFLVSHYSPPYSEQLTPSKIWSLANRVKEWRLLKRCGIFQQSSSVALHQPGGFCQLVAPGLLNIWHFGNHITRVTLRFGNSRTILYFAPNVVPILLHRLRTLDSFTSASGKITISPTLNPLRVFVTSIFLLGLVVIDYVFLLYLFCRLLNTLQKYVIILIYKTNCNFFCSFLRFYFYIQKFIT